MKQLKRFMGIIIVLLLASQVFAAYTGTTIKDLDTTKPNGATEPVNILDDAERETKSVLKNQYAFTNLSGALTLTATNNIVNCTKTCTVTLPTPSTVASSSYTKQYVIKNSSTASTATISGTVDGTSNPTIAVKDSMIIYTDGTSWFEKRVKNATNATNADTVDTYHADATATQASKIPVRDGTGRLVKGDQQTNTAYKDEANTFTGGQQTIQQGSAAVGIRIERPQASGNIVLQFSDAVDNANTIELIAGTNDLLLGGTMRVQTNGTMTAGIVPLARVLNAAAGSSGEAQGSTTAVNNVNLVLDSVTAGDRIWVTGYAEVTVTGSPNYTDVWWSKTAGTATVDFAGGTVLLQRDTSTATGPTKKLTVSGVCRVTGSGTLTLSLYIGTDGTISSRSIYAHAMDAKGN